MATRPVLTVKERKVFGREVRKLRREGVLPANLFGKKIKSEALALPLKEFAKIYEQVGETGLVDLKTDGKSHSVLIHNVQLDPVKNEPIHVDFHEVSLTEKTKARIPIEFVGEAPAVEQKIGILIQPLSEVEVEALPTDLPEKIQVDISSLKAVDESLTVADLKVDTKTVTVLADKDEVVVKIEPPAKEEVVTPPPTEGVEAPAEGEVPAEGVVEAGKETPAEEGKPQEGGQAENTAKD